jgi:hypothetical protein
MIGRRTLGLFDMSPDYRGPAIRRCLPCQAGEVHTEDRHRWECGDPHSWRCDTDDGPWCSRCGTDRGTDPCVP